MDALLAIAKNQDRPFLEVVMEAVDQYIEREKGLLEQSLQ
jgi:hypothetical protein